MADNSAKLIDTNEITPQSNYVIIDADGKCCWEPRYELSVTHCNVNVAWFPFDVQKCKVVFQSWMLDNDRLNITTPDDNDSLSLYVTSDEWNLTCKRT